MLRKHRLAPIEAITATIEAHGIDILPQAQEVGDGVSLSATTISHMKMATNILKKYGYNEVEAIELVRNLDITKHKTIGSLVTEALYGTKTKQTK